MSTQYRTPTDSIQHALAIFFPFYVLVEVPSNMMMKRTRPALWIPFIMVCWGICTTLMGEYAMRPCECSEVEVD